MADGEARLTSVQSQVCIPNGGILQAVQGLLRHSTTLQVASKTSKSPRPSLSSQLSAAPTMRPFENPSNTANTASGMTYKQASRAGLLAGGIGLVAWYLAARRDTRKSPAEDFIGDPIHPTTGTATREGDRSHKQH